MKISVYTEHSLYVEGDDDQDFRAKVDSDGTVRLSVPGAADEDEGDGRVASRWLDRDDLLAIRALVNKALLYVRP